MSAILIMEMRGFADIASVLAKELDVIAVTPERVRSAGILITNDAITRAGQNIHITGSSRPGGDTWCFTFDEIPDALMFACRLLNEFQKLTLENGIYFLKPAMALTTGSAKFDGESVLDDNSITIIRAADKGKSYELVAIGEAVNLVKQVDWITTFDKPETSSSAPLSCLVDWRSVRIADGDTGSTSVILPALLLDNEIIFSNSNQEAVEILIREQERAHSILAFGGPIPFDIPIYRSYLSSALAVIKNNPDCIWTVLSYLPLNEACSTYAWLQICRRLMIYYPSNFAFAAFPIPEGQLRPFSYHIFDDCRVQIGLRSFSPQKGTPTMSSAIMIRNRKISTRFKEEFMENWRRIGQISDEEIGRIVSQIKGLSNELRRSATKAVDELLDANRL